MGEGKDAAMCFGDVIPGCWGSDGTCESSGTRRRELISVKTKATMGKTAKVMSFWEEKVFGALGKGSGGLKGQFSQG